MRNSFNDLEDVIYSKIKYGLSDELKTKFPNIEVGTSDINESDETFPYIYVHLLPMIETGTDLEMATVDTVIATVQIEVTDNQSQRNTSEVMTEVVEILKKMAFKGTQMPYNDNSTNYRKISRFRRTISKNDVI